MSQLRLYLDEDSMNRALLLALRERNIDVLTVNEVQNQGLTDEAQLLWAFNQGEQFVHTMSATSANSISSF